ncbi:MAG: hypothetical protein R3E39_08835 [Anaerolineae bacterium]
MTELPNNTPSDEQPTGNNVETDTPNNTPEKGTNPVTPAAANAATPPGLPEDNAAMEERLERLGGEPAPAITPEEFARLQKAGQVHIDARGRVKTARRSDAEAGVSLRKRRAWYGG